jgi:hypothetical protein
MSPRSIPTSSYMQTTHVFFHYSWHTQRKELTNHSFAGRSLLEQPVLQQPRAGAPASYHPAIKSKISVFCHYNNPAIRM